MKILPGFIKFNKKKPEWHEERHAKSKMNGDKNHELGQSTRLPEITASQPLDSGAKQNIWLENSSSVRQFARWTERV
jgi:hypothetical protein